MVTRKIAVNKKYVVKLIDEEREQLHALIRTGKRSAQLTMKARILLKADASEKGPGWSDNQIVAALETSAATVGRARQQLVEEGFEAVLIRKHRATSARRRVFDGEAEAKLIALACSQPPAGRARWTLRLLEEKVVERDIVARVSANRTGLPRFSAARRSRSPSCSATSWAFAQKSNLSGELPRWSAPGEHKDDPGR